MQKTKIQITQAVYPTQNRDEYQRQLADQHAALFAEMLFKLCPNLKREVQQPEKKAA